MKDLTKSKIVGKSTTGQLVAGTVKRQDEDGVFISVSGLEDEHREEYVYFEDITSVNGKLPTFASTAMKDDVESQLIQLFGYIGMDIPSNYEDIVQFVYEDILDCADIEKWNHSDVVIGFRRFIESVNN